ncbi:transposase [Streptomyces sp. NPDC091406]|uniref:transposase n=1 Tax=unclassified Streptomyces TaxID=2593676 RepID=UPI00380A4C01
MIRDLVPDDLWARIAPILPPPPQRRNQHPGRRRTDDRTAPAGILFVLRTHTGPGKLVTGGSRGSRARRRPRRLALVLAGESRPRLATRHPWARAAVARRVLDTELVVEMLAGSGRHGTLTVGSAELTCG